MSALFLKCCAHYYAQNRRRINAFAFAICTFIFTVCILQRLRASNFKIHRHPGGRCIFFRTIPYNAKICGRQRGRGRGLIATILFLRGNHNLISLAPETSWQAPYFHLMMATTDEAAGFSLRGIPSFTSKLAKALTGGRSAYALSALTLLSPASLAFLESSLVWSVYITGVAFVILCSIITISLQDRSKASRSTQKSLDQPSPKKCSSAVAAVGPKVRPSMAVEANAAPSPAILSITKEISLDSQPNAQAKHVSTVFAKAPSLLPEDMPKVTVTQASAVTNDPVAKETTGESLAEECIATVPTIVSVTKETGVDSQPDAQVKHAMTVLLPENVLKANSTQAFGATNNPVVKDITCENMSTERLSKKPFNTFKGEGEIHFLHQTKMWGRIRLSTPTKWGETMVFFYRKQLIDNPNVLLFYGQSVKVEYYYRRKKKENMDVLRACSFEIIAPSPRREPKSWRPSSPREPKCWRLSPPREPKCWRSRSNLRRPSSPPSRASVARPVHIAQGPPADGRRGFRLQRTTVA